MVRGSLQQTRRPAHFSSWLSRQRLFARFPDCHRAWHPHSIFQSEFGEFVAEFGVNSIGRVGQHNPTGYFRCRPCPDLLQRDLRLSLKLHPGRHFCLIPPFGLLGPFFRQVQAIGDRQTGTSTSPPTGSHCQRQLSLFAYLSVLARHPHRWRATPDNLLRITRKQYEILLGSELAASTEPRISHRDPDVLSYRFRGRGTRCRL